MHLQDLLFPLDFSFKVTTLANRLSVTDANGRRALYVKQLHHDEFSESSLLNIDPFIDEITVFKDASEAEAIYTIKAVPWKNFTASFGFLDAKGQVLGYVARVTWVPELAAHYQVFDQHLQAIFTIREGAGWVRASDTALGRIPFLGLFTGYFLNPSYHVTRPGGALVATLQKQKSFLARKFSVYKESTCTVIEQEQILLSLLLMTIQERRRG
ncbi:hypothetical protein [Rufibacter ruber]|uniref:hypothetical protein n=1 Tax=Rufibacter ruber TaxID=1783499 RepID=UPI000834ED99|nr:hypothetical protein [Rufibacter ruber]